MHKFFSLLFGQLIICLSHFLFLSFHFMTGKWKTFFFRLCTSSFFFSLSLSLFNFTHYQSLLCLFLLYHTLTSKSLVLTSFESVKEKEYWAELLSD